MILHFSQSELIVFAHTSLQFPTSECLNVLVPPLQCPFPFLTFHLCQSVMLVAATRGQSCLLGDFTTWNSLPSHLLLSSIWLTSSLVVSESGLDSSLRIEDTATYRKQTYQANTSNQSANSAFEYIYQFIVSFWLASKLIYNNEFLS